MQTSPEYKNAWLQLNQTIAKLQNSKIAASSNITIPVVFHVVYKNVNENVSDAQIMSQLDVLNKDFRRLNADTLNTFSDFEASATDALINFCLAQRTPDHASTTGITRTLTTNSSFSLTDNSIFLDSLGGKDIWDSKKYLNIYICDLDGVIGFAGYPGTSAYRDGIVIDFEHFGTTGTATAPYNKGRTATHEIGHWLNLMHIWGDASCGDDFVADTPTQEQANYGCPAHPSPSCGNNGDMFQNFMDYTNDACMNLFTVGQQDRMHAAITLSRNELNTSVACYPPQEDISILQTNIDEGDVICKSNIDLEILLQNNSNIPLYTADIFVQLNNDSPVLHEWTGSIGASGNAIIPTSNLSVTPGSHTLMVYCSNPNGAPDNNLFNDTLFINFTVSVGEEYNININTDNYGEEVFWNITDDNNNILASDSNLTSNQNNFGTYCLYSDSCLTFTIYDIYGDGICCDFGDGYIEINGQVYTGNYGNELSIDLCDITSESYIEKVSVSLYPNPSLGKFTIKSGCQIKAVNIYNQIGVLLFNKNFQSSIANIDVSKWSNGLYLVEVVGREQKEIQKLILNR